VAVVLVLLLLLLRLLLLLLLLLLLQLLLLRLLLLSSNDRAQMRTPSAVCWPRFRGRRRGRRRRLSLSDVAAQRGRRAHH
jgi:hypothetical protein